MRMSSSRLLICLLPALSLVPNARLRSQSTPFLAQNIEQVRYADQFLAGGSDIGAAINAAFADCSYHCMVKVPANSSSYSMGTPVTLNQGETLCGDGSANTTLVYSGSGYAITITPTAYPSFTQNQVKLCGLTLLGTSSASGGINMHDVMGTILDDLAISGFTGTNAAGIWMNNQNAWTERTSMLHVALGKDNGGNSIGLRMSVNSPGSTSPSMSFSRFLDLRFNLAAGQVGVQIENGVNFSNSTMIATFNVDAVSTAFNIESGAYAQANDLRIFGEAPAGSTAVNLASGATFGGQGYILINGASNNLTSGGVYQVGSESLFDSFGNFQFGARQISGYTIGAGTSSVSFSPAFTSTSSYVCTFSYNGTGIGSASAISYQIVSPSQIIVSSQPYIGVNYVCTGN